MLKLISEHDPSVPFNVTEPCRWLGLSEAYVLRLFHREVGKTLRQSVLDARMERAVELLRNCERPIKQIAHECGYRDISNFYRDFKNVHAATPKELRLRARADMELYVRNSSSFFPQHSC